MGNHNSTKTKLTEEDMVGNYFIEKCCIGKFDNEIFQEFYKRFYDLEKDEQKLMFCFISGAVAEIRKNSILGTMDRLKGIVPND